MSTIFPSDNSEKSKAFVVLFHTSVTQAGAYVFIVFGQSSSFVKNVSVFAGTLIGVVCVTRSL